MFSVATIALAICIALPAPKTRIEPHADPALHGGCASCHVVNGSGEVVAGELTGTVDEVCARCHGYDHLGNSHPRDVEPGGNEHSVEPEGLPLADGRITCVTCHDPHGRWVTLNSIASRQQPLFTELVRGREVAYYQAYYLRIDECGEGYTSLCASCHKGY